MTDGSVAAFQRADAAVAAFVLVGDDRPFFIAVPAYHVVRTVLIAGSAVQTLIIDDLHANK